MAVAPEQMSGLYPDESTPDAPPMAKPPDWATYIPTETLDALKNQDAADNYSIKAQGQIADLYGVYAEWQTQQAVQAVAPQWGEPSPTEDGTQGPSEAQVPDGTGAPDVNPVTAEPTTNPVVSQFLDGLGGLLDKMRPGPDAGQHQPASLNPLDIGGALADRVTEAEGRTPVHPDSIPVVSGLAHFGGDMVTPPAGGVASTEGIAEQVPSAARQFLDARGQPAIQGASEAVGREALNAAHPIVQAVVDAAQQAGSTVKASAVARYIQSPGFNPENLAKATGRIGPVQTAALTAWKVAQDPEMAAAVVDAAKPAASDMAREFDALPTLAQRAGKDVAPLEASAPGGPASAPSAGPPVPEPAPYTGAGTSLLAENPVVKGLNAVQGVLKQAVIGGSIFHPLVESAQLGRTAMAEAAPVAGAQGIVAANRAFVSSGFAQRFAAENADWISRAEQAGATMVRIGGDVSPDVQQVGNRIVRTLLSSTGSGIAGYASAKAQGESDEDALKRAGMFALGGAGVAQIAPALNAALWGRMVPVAKVEAFKILEPNYGADVAAKRVNDIFGGQNLVQLGRNAEVQTILRSTFLAPDWLESWARNLGAVVKPGPEGNAARKWWAATGISSALTLEGLNMAINGHPTTENEPGRQLALEVTPLLKAAGQNPPQRVYADILELGPLGSVLNAANKGGIGAVGSNLATGHLNVLPDIALQAERNQAPTGGQIVSQGTPAERAALPEVAAGAAHVAPIGLSAFEKGDLPLPAQATSAATGIRLYEGPAVKAAKTAVNPAAPASAGTGTNLKNTRSFLMGKAPAAVNPAAPAKGASNLNNSRTLLR